MRNGAFRLSPRSGARGTGEETHAEQGPQGDEAERSCRREPRSARASGAGRGGTGSPRSPWREPCDALTLDLASPPGKESPGVLSHRPGRAGDTGPGTPGRREVA